MNDLTHIGLWEKCLQTIKEYVSDQVFNTWFLPIKPIRLEGNVLTIQVPNKYFYEWLEEHYVNLLKKTITSHLNSDAKLEYLVPRTNSNPPKVAEKKTQDRDQPNTKINIEQVKNPYAIPGIKKIKIDPQVNLNYRFSNYIEGECNRLARSAGIAVSRSPGQTAFNPLVVFGGPGLGKTHLVHAIANEILEKNTSKIVLCVSAEKFANDLIESVKNNSVSDFVNYYQLIDVLIIDDIQFLANKQKTQDIFFHLFNHLHQNKKQLILTSDRPPKDLNGLEERLISRFKWGLSADLQVPDLETRIAIAESKLQQEGIDMAPEIVRFISSNIHTNVRELEGALISLIARSTLNNREIDMELAREVLRNFVHSLTKEVTVETIAKMVSQHFGVEIEQLKDKTRKRAIVMARQLAMYFAQNLTDKSLKVIGEHFGGRDHSTVIHACKAVRDLLETDDSFKETVIEIENKIKMSMQL